MVKASSRPAASTLTSRPSDDDRERRKRHAEGERLAGLDAAGRDRPLRGARHHRVDVGVVPHVERAGGAGADRDAEQRGESRSPDASCPGAITRPTKAVNTTSDITRGFSSAK